MNSRPKITTLTYGIVKNHKDGERYLYLDYEPQPGIQWPWPRDHRKPGTYPDIMAWVWQEYGLKAQSPQIARVRRKHGVFTGGGHGRPLPAGVEPAKIPPEKEAAIETALRHFGMLPDEN